MHGVYKYECDGKVIYIGKTDSSFTDRIYRHACEEKFKPYLSKAVIYICAAEDEYEADFWETVLITEHKPILNVSKKMLTSASVHIDLKWEKYDPKQKKRINPHKYSGRKTRHVQLLTTSSLIERIDAYAKEMNVSRSELLDTIAEKFLSDISK